MATSNEQGDATTGFYDSATTKDFSKATGYLTLLINLILYIYWSVKGESMEDGLLVPLILLLSTGYVLIIFDRPKNLALKLHVFGMVINVALLFTSLTGTNKMLDKINEARKGPDSSPATVTHASVGDFFLHMIFPASAVFSEKKEALKLIDKTNQQIAATISATDSQLQSSTQTINTIIESRTALSDSFNHLVVSKDKTIDTLTTLNNSSKEKLVACSSLISELKPQVTAPTLIAKIDLVNEELFQQTQNIVRQQHNQQQQKKDQNDQQQRLQKVQQVQETKLLDQRKQLQLQQNGIKQSGVNLQHKRELWRLQKR